MTDFFARKVTIYNDIPAGKIEPRHFDRYVIPLCNVQTGYVTKADGTVQNIINAITVITKAIDKYKPPMEYAAIPLDMRGEYFTANIGDFVVLDEVDDVVETAQDFAALKNKYKNNGFQVVSVAANIYGMAVDNVTLASA